MAATKRRRNRSGLGGLKPRTVRGSGQERWRRLAVERGDAGLGDVVDDVAVLLLEGGGDREDAFDEATAGGAMGEIGRAHV